jgi:hypothetical protein
MNELNRKAALQRPAFSPAARGLINSPASGPEGSFHPSIVSSIKGVQISKRIARQKTAQINSIRIG